LHLALLLDYRPRADPGGIDEQRWISDAEVVETTFTAFTGRRRADQITARGDRAPGPVKLWSWAPLHRWGESPRMGALTLNHWGVLVRSLRSQVSDEVSRAGVAVAGVKQGPPGEAPPRPEWLSMTADHGEAYAGATLAGRRLYLYGTMGPAVAPRRRCHVLAAAAPRPYGASRWTRSE
jgi:hypothetical protein